jgi:hypothetical protein
VLPARGRWLHTLGSPIGTDRPSVATAVVASGIVGSTDLATDASRSATAVESDPELPSLIPAPCDAAKRCGVR